MFGKIQTASNIAMSLCVPLSLFYFISFYFIYFSLLCGPESSIIYLNQFPSSLRVCLALSISSFTLRNSSICLARCSCKFLSCSSIVACSWLSAFSKFCLCLCLSSRILSVVSRSWASLSEETVCSNAACSSVVRFPTCSRYWNRWQC